jgi:hypothetical protein
MITKIVLFIYLAILWFAHQSVLGADASNAAGVVDKVADAVIEKVLAEDYAVFHVSFVGDFGTNDARAAIALMKKAKDVADRAGESEDARRDAFEAQRAAWRVCFQVRRNSTDRGVKEIIFGEWEAALTGSVAAAVAPIYALSEVWDREMLSDNFWSLLQNTKDKKTIAAITYLIYKSGDDSDQEKLVHKRDSLVDPTLRQIIRNEINWREFNKSGAKNSPGPAALRPTMEY